jgi:flagellar assembly factor FliW
LTTITTTRFGKLKIDQKRLLHFPEGLLGFPENKDYAILEHRKESPFCWLQSINSPELAFVVTNPLNVKKDYLENLSPDEREFFEPENGGNLIVFAIVTIPPGEVEKMTVNLLGPLVIDTASRIGRQVILVNSGYSHHHPLMPD